MCPVPAFQHELFLSTPSARRATRLFQSTLNCTDISIHALREEGDGGFGVGCRSQIISIHALREEGDAQLAALTAELEEFLSTPSARRATSQTASAAPAPSISIHALREEGDPSHQRRQDMDKISIHALREEGDSP